MIYRTKNELERTPIEGCMGGNGTVWMEKLLTGQEEMMGKGRAYVRHTLNPGVSIGIHTHEGEMETMVIVRGKAVHTINGQDQYLEEGDIISAIDGEDITEDEVSDVADIVRNSDKDSVVLTVHREGAEDAMEITVPVTDVELPSVFHEMLDSKIGYIRITQFTGVTGEQYQEAFDDLQKQGMEKMIVDLRDNPGGLLDSVCDVLRKILPEGLIVYTEDKDGNREEEKCDGKNELRIPLAVLVNESSASASEIFAGAVQDYGIGTIVGTTTYGKGVVQSIRQLSDGSAIKLTVANYYTPKGNNINKTGIKPDIEVSLDTSLLNKNKDEITHDEDNQLQKAIKAVEKEK